MKKTRFEYRNTEIDWNYVLAFTATSLHLLQLISALFNVGGDE